MNTFFEINRNSYYDSVTLMLIATEIKKLPNINNAVVGMCTDYNLDSLKRLGMFQDAFLNLTPNDLLICVQTDNIESGTKAIETAKKLLQTRKIPQTLGTPSIPITQEAAFKIQPDTDLVLISVPGNYAAREAKIALESGKHVMLFSDNVSIEEEFELKKLALEKKLLLMGPDCGTAIINHVPLAFANVVRPGSIGIVAASGTGLQEVSSIIHRLGFGISQAIGVGGRDLSEKIGGMMTLAAVKALADDSQTKIITLISKPPAEKTLERLYSQLREIKKPIVIYFIGADQVAIQNQGFYAATNLEDAAIKSCELAGNIKISSLVPEDIITKMAENINLDGKYLRGLYSGGTLCDEAQRLLQPVLGEIYSNTPVKGCLTLKNIFESLKHTIIDLGDDEFTRGKAHPMIDPTLRQERLIAESRDPNTGMIIFDVVLGFGSHPNMAGELVTAINQARKERQNSIIYAATLCGTEEDPQNYAKQLRILEEAGVKVFPSNVSLIKFVSRCFNKE